MISENNQLPLKIKMELISLTYDRIGWLVIQTSNPLLPIRIQLSLGNRVRNSFSS